MIVRITKYTIAALAVSLLIYFYTSSLEVGIVVTEDEAGRLAATIVTVVAQADGSLSVNDESVQLENLEEMLAPLMGDGVRVEVRVHPETDNMLVVQVMDAAGRAGAGPGSVSIVNQVPD